MRILALVATIVLFTNTIFAGLVVDLRAVSVNGTTDTVSSDQKTVTVTNVGDVVKFELWASVQGYSDPNQAQTITLLRGWLKETVPSVSSYLRGDMATIPATGATAADVYGPVFNYNPLPHLSLNAYGDKEFGDSNYAWDVRAAAAQDAKAPLYIGTFSYTVTALASQTTTPTVIDFVPKTSAFGALWMMDGAGKTGSGGFTSAGPVSIVPEPATLVLLGMSALALIFVRRRK